VKILTTHSVYLSTLTLYILHKCFSFNLNTCKQFSNAINIFNIEL
jgi:hypothetical protein